MAIFENETNRYSCISMILLSLFLFLVDSNPLSPDYDFIMNNKLAEFNAGIELLQFLTDGKVHLQTRPKANDIFTNAKNAV